LVPIALTVLLIASLAANGYLYFSVNSNLQNKIVELKSEVSTIESQTVSLQNQLDHLQNNSRIDNQTIANLHGQILDLQTLNSNLQDQNGNLTIQIQDIQNRLSTERSGVPKLVTFIGATFTTSIIRTEKGALNFLHVVGAVINEGNSTAYNCALKIKSRTTNGTAYTDYYGFAALLPGESVQIDINIFHDDLANWVITPEWTNSP
jgi:hypothetical protein